MNNVLDWTILLPGKIIVLNTSGNMFSNYIIYSHAAIIVNNNANN